MIPGLDYDKCVQRNRIAAHKGVETASLKFKRDSEIDVSKMTVIDQHGARPKDNSAMLAAINGMLPDGAPPLTEDDIFVHYAEAASNRFISDRYGFLASSTLHNIATGGMRGSAFMNSHRTGDMSTPSELPYGKTFAGQYVQAVNDTGKIIETCELGFYMLRGIHPNGSAGPDTDTLHKMIDGGTLFDVSVGLSPGERGKVICNVCNQRLRQCNHYPGTNRNMELEDQKYAEEVLGVPGGLATYRLEFWELSELSGVYDGAIPGAGFAKGWEALSSFTANEATQFLQAFSPFIK